MRSVVSTHRANDHFAEQLREVEDILLQMALCEGRTAASIDEHYHNGPLDAVAHRTEQERRRGGGEQRNDCYIPTRSQLACKTYACRGTDASQRVHLVRFGRWAIRLPAHDMHQALN